MFKMKDFVEMIGGFILAICAIGWFIYMSPLNSSLDLYPEDVIPYISLMGILGFAIYNGAKLGLRKVSEYRTLIAKEKRQQYKNRLMNMRVG